MPRKTRTERLAIEARRRAGDAARIAATQLAYADRVAAALAVTDEYEWKPWGYEVERPPVRPAVPQLRLVHSRPRIAREPGAREQFARRLAVAA